VRKRLENAKNELAMSEQYKFKVVNDVVARAAAELDSIVLSAGASDR
jgi:guanylate kinase